jgi:hypothetical protein
VTGSTRGGPGIRAVSDPPCRSANAASGGHEEELVKAFRWRQQRKAIEVCVSPPGSRPPAPARARRNREPRASGRHPGCPTARSSVPGAEGARCSRRSCRRWWTRWIPAACLRLARQVARAPASRSLEEHVLQHMRDPHPLVGLVSNPRERAWPPRPREPTRRAAREW